MTDTTNLMISSEDPTTPQNSPVPIKKGRARTLRRSRNPGRAKGKRVTTLEKQLDTIQQVAAYEDVKAVLMKAYPEALTMDELSTATGNHWKQAEILLATNHGTLVNELLRDATYYPARYKINPDVVPLFTEPVSGQAEPAAESSDNEEIADQPKVTIIRKKKRKLEMPKAKTAQKVDKPAKKARSSGVFKDIVTYLVQSGEHLTVDEIREKAGLQSSKAVLTTTLSDRFAKKDIARDESTKPFRYFVSDELKDKYIALYGIKEAAAAPVEISVEEPVLKAAQTVAPAAKNREVAAVKRTEAPAVASSDFDATITLSGLLTVTINGQAVTLEPDWTRKLARMIRFMAE